MALHTTLPIHQMAFKLLSVATDYARNIPRDIKVGLGRKLADECIEVLVLIGRANAAQDKTPHLDALLEHVQVIEYLMRVFADKHFISVAQHADAIALTESIGRQANGWRRKYAK